MAKPPIRYWKFFCEEHRYPGLWHTWFKNQVVAVGWSALWGFKLTGGRSEPGWSRARKQLAEMSPGDWVVVQLMHSRIGRVGRIVELQVEDDRWQPTVKPVSGGRSRVERDGENGRRILVRWDLSAGSLDPDWVTHLPKEARFSPGKIRPAVCKLDRREFDRIRAAIQDEKNWVTIIPGFEHETALSDFLAQNPHRLGDGLRAYPGKLAREMRFRDGTRADVLLVDSDGALVVVECKQGPPEVDHVRQLRRYLQQVSVQRRSERVRGVLVHGGARWVSREVLSEARRRPRVDLVRYDLSLEFVPTS
jgi:hypothetical protein